MKRQAVNAGFDPALPLSQALQVGELLFISGQVSYDPADLNHRVVGEGDPTAQLEQCFRNLEAVLAAAGGSLEDLVKVNGYLTDAEYLPIWRAVRQKVLGHVDPMPVSTVVVVTALAGKGLLVEVEAVAQLPVVRE